MSSTSLPRGSASRLLSLSARLGRADTVEDAVDRTAELTETVFDQPVTSVYEYHPDTETVTAVGSSAPSTRVERGPDRMPGTVVEQLEARRDDPVADDTPRATTTADTEESLEAEIFAPVGHRWVLCLGVTDPDGFDETDVTVVEEIAAILETTLARIERLERYEKVVETVDDPVYALDADGQFTVQNKAARQVLGDGERPGVEGVRAQHRRLLETDTRATTAQFELEAADGDRCDVESHLALVGDSETAGAVGVLRGGAGRRERGLEQEATVDALKRVYRVTTDPDLPFEEKVDRLLETGREYLDLPNGFLTHVDTSGEEGGTQTIVDSHGSHDLLQPGESCPLPQSYCRRTVDRDDITTLTNASKMGWVGDPAHDLFGLETYIGGTVTAGGELYGTLCFASTEPRKQEFTETEQMFVSLLRRWVVYEVGRETIRQELRQQQKRLQLVLSGTGTGVAEWELETDSVAWDDTLQETVGRNPETFEGFVDLVHPDDRGRVRDRLETMLETDEPWEGEFRVVAGSGDVIWLGARVVPVSENGEPVRVLATGTDVTDRRERDQWVSQFLDYGPLMFVQTRSVDGEAVVADCNGSFASRLGYETEEVVGRPLAAFYDEASADSLQTGGYEQALDDKLELAERTLLTSDGRSVPCLLRAVPRDRREQSVGTAALFVDISDRRETERRYRRLAANIPNGGVFTFDTDLNYRLAAGELLPELGIDESEVHQAAVGTVLSRGDFDLVSRCQAALDGERTDRRVAFGDRTLRVHVVPVDSDDRLAEDCGLLLVQDVTDEARRERELYRERERFRLLTENDNEYAFLVVGEDGTIQTWNDSAGEMFGYDAETVVGTSMSRFYPAPDRKSELPERLLQQARVAGESTHEGWRVRADGSEFYAEVLHAPLRTDNGEFRGYAKIVRDMTDQRRQQRRTERFVEESEDVVTIVDPDGTLSYVSGSANRVLGHDHDEIAGENLFDYLHPNDREEAMETFFGSLERPGSDTEAECRFRSGDGEWLTVSGQCQNLLEDDAIDGMLLYLRDVTEVKKRARRFQSIFNQTYQFTALLETDGTVLEVNDAALEFGGLGRDAIVGEPFHRTAWWTHDETVQSQVRDAMDRAADGEFVRYETPVRGADGIATIDFSVKPVTDERGTVTTLVAEGRDVTNREQQRQHLEVTQRVMRHNMRNDLTKMRGWTEMMCEESDPERRAEQFETVARVLDRWETMTEKLKQIRQILEFMQGRWITKEAGPLVETAVAPVREANPEAAITTDLLDEESVQVPATLLEAVRELTENAVAATTTPSVEVGLASPDDGWVEVEVRDDGPGLPEMETGVLETGEETPLSHGQGLGLWMVRMIVTQAGGDVTVEVGPEGTNICLRLPTEQVLRTAN